MLLNKKNQLVELQVQGIPSTGNNAQRFQFTDQPYLRFKSIISLEAYCVELLPLSPSGLALPTYAQMQNAFLTLYINDPDGVDGQGEWIQNLPLIDLIQAQNNSNIGNQFNKFWLDHIVVYWDKCYITMSAPLGNETPLSFVLNVGFETTKASQALNS